jgi:hypothetical protein
VRNGDVPDSLVVELAAAACRSVGDELQEPAAQLAAPVGEKRVRVGDHLGRGARHPLGAVGGDLDIVEERHELERPGDELVAVAAIDAQEVGEDGPGQREGVVHRGVEALALDEVVQEAVRGVGHRLPGPRCPTQPRVQDPAHPLVVAAFVGADQPRRVARDGRDRARRRAVGEAAHAVVAQARVVGERGVDLVVAEDEPLAEHRVVDDGVLTGRSFELHRPEISSPDLHRSRHSSVLRSQNGQVALELPGRDLHAVVLPLLALDLDEAVEHVLAERAQHELGLGGELDRLAQRLGQLLDP